VRWRDDRVGKILSEALDGRSRNTGRIKFRRIAADDSRHGDAAGCCSVLVERGCDIRDMPVETPLRDEGAGKDSCDENAKRQTQQLILDH
jgi:hypothetical protein